MSLVRKPLILLVLPFFALTAVAAAQTSRGLEPSDFYQIRSASTPVLSPDGRLVAYVVASADRTQNRRPTDLWIAAVDGSSVWPVVTGQNAHAPQWSPDGKWLAFLAVRPVLNPPPGAPAPRPQVYAVSPTRGGEPRALTNVKDGVDGFSWSPEGHRLALTSRGAPTASADKDKGERSDLKRYTHSLYKMDGQGYFDERRTHIFVADLERGTTTQVTSGDARNDEVPVWSPDGRTLLFSATRTDVDDEGFLDVLTVPASGGPVSKVSDVVYRISDPVWSPDGTRIAYVGAKDPHIPRLHVVSAKGGPSQVIAESFTFPTDLSWSADGRALYAIDPVKGESQLFRIDVAAQTVTPVTSGPRTVAKPDLQPAAGRMTYLVTTPMHPADVFVADLSGANERRVTDLNHDWLAPIALSPVERFTYKSVDGLDIDGFFMKPVGWEQGRQYPMILCVHGGPNGMYGMRWEPDFQAMAAHGYAVVFTNPRGSSGYGGPFQRAVTNEWGGKAYEDIMRGVDTALARYPWVDRTRLAVTGQSYGGFMTDWIVGHTHRFAAAIALSGISDFISVEGTRDGFYGHAADLGGDMFDRFDVFWNTSPLKYAAQVKTPTLILHGDADERVPLLQGEEFFRALRHFDVPAELVVFPREPHSLRREPRHQVEVIQLTLDWCDRYLKATGSQSSHR